MTLGPKCQGAAARDWLAERQAELLPVGYFHIVFTLPAQIADIAYQNKAVIYDILFKASAETMLTIAADPKHLGARIGFTAVLHTWGSAMTHHPHAHMIVPGGGISADGTRWIACRPTFFLSVRVLSRLFRRRVLERLRAAHQDGRLIRLENGAVSFRYKDYRCDGPERYKTMSLEAHEFIRRFLVHVLPRGFHRIRHGACPGLDPGACWPTAAVFAISPWPTNCSASERRTIPPAARLRQTAMKPTQQPSPIPIVAAP